MTGVQTCALPISWGLAGRLPYFTTLLRSDNQELTSLKGMSPENIWGGASMESLVENVIIANLIDRHPKAVKIRSFISGTEHHLLGRHVMESSKRRYLFIQGCSWCVCEECANSRLAEVT